MDLVLEEKGLEELQGAVNMQQEKDMQIRQVISQSSVPATLKIVSNFTTYLIFGLICFDD